MLKSRKNFNLDNFVVVNDGNVVGENTWEYRFREIYVGTNSLINELYF